MMKFKKYDGMVPGADVPDIGVITKLEPVGDVYNGIGDDGLDTDEFDEVKDEGRFVYTVSVQLITRPGKLVHIPYLFSGMSGAGVQGMVPTAGQGVLVFYVGVARNPVAIGGYNLWTVMRRLVADGVFPELKPGEVISQAAIRDNPMSFLVGQQSEATPVDAYLEVLKGGRIYQDFKGRVIIESRHYRADGSDGAFVQTVYGNPAVSQADDEANDFNEKDGSAGSYIAMQTRISPRPGEDPVFIMNVTQDGMLALEFVKGWFGRAPGEGETPPVSVEVDVAGGLVTLDAPSIKHGREASEKAVLGDTLVGMMEDLIDYIINMRQPVGGAGPTAGPPMNLGDFLTLKSQLSTMLSNTNLVE